MGAIRVVHVINKLNGGGAEEQLRILLQYLPRDRFECVVWCADSEGSAGIVSQGIRVRRAPRRFRFDARWGALHRFLREWNPDVVHNWLPATIWTSVVPALIQRDLPILGGFRNTYQLASLRRIIHLGAFMLVDRIASNTRDPGPGYRRLLTDRNGVVIPNAIDFGRVRGAKGLLEPEWEGGKDGVFLFAGRLVEQKNLQLAIRAVDFLRKEGWAVQLVVCGEGPLKSELRELAAKCGVTDAVLFRGFSSDLPSVMKSVDALVVPSLREGMPNVVFEAIAVGLPVIVSRIPAHLQWLSHEQHALVFDPASVEELAFQMRRFMEESLENRSKRVEGAMSLVEALSGSKMAADYAALYEEMTEKGRKSQ